MDPEIEAALWDRLWFRRFLELWFKCLAYNLRCASRLQEMAGG
ncbi:MAG: hypothetical protein OXR64_09190 [Chloroflexota bacterium]|nr:hypothetical protein [Chloroflexota bacterium]MDE2920007.1 hypothetical protein [Chloroflexota bacterium]